MQLRTRSTGFVRTEGGILPPDLLERVRSLDLSLPGLDETSYGLARNERFGEAITRSWLRLRSAWETFTDELPNVPPSDPATTTTRERFLLPLMDELGYGRLTPVRSVELDGKAYPISHAYRDALPLHLVGANVPLDRRSRGIAGAAGQSPHGLVQELLNRSPGRLWGIVTNGRTLRILRDNASLTRLAFVEFDLEAIFIGEAYADFALLWHLAHRTRLEARAAADGADGTSPSVQACYLEQWSKEAAQTGARARDRLRDGVQEAIETLGSGFLAHPANGDLRAALQAGGLDTQDYYREMLRLVYRLILLFVAEDRDLLLDPKASPETRERYTRYYSTGRLRRLAEHRRGSRHADLYAGLRVVFAALGGDEGAAAIGLPSLGGFLFGPDACPHLDGTELANADLLQAVRKLATIEERGVLRLVDYRNLGSEELGSIYESLLELHPELDVAASSFALRTASGHERKTTGSYYTPTSLIGALLDSALDPVLAEVADKPTTEEAERAILELAIVDPAAGSGHFLVAAAHRIAKGLAQIRTGDEEPAPASIRTALRDVIGHCLYAVDLNPMAVELCKVSLWLEALEPGKPLTFLDAHIKCGNSLLGTTPELTAKGIPDAAYEPIEGDDRGVARSWRDRNRKEREGQQTLFEAPNVSGISALAAAAHALDTLSDETPSAARTKAARFSALVASPDYNRLRAPSDAWCAAFVVRKSVDSPEVTTAGMRAIATDVARTPGDLLQLIDRTAVERSFFHWPIEFPAVFARGGFNVVVGNPPWDQIEVRDPADPQAHQIRGLQHFFAGSGMYPSSGSGRRNLFALFVERALALVGAAGRIGLVVPTGIVTDHPYEALTRRLVDGGALVSLFDFENRGRFFPHVHRQYRFALLTLSGSPNDNIGATYGFLLDDVSDTRSTSRTWTMTPSDVAMVSPARFAVPAFRSSIDATITKTAYSAGVSLKELSDQGVLESALLLNFDERSAFKIDGSPPDRPQDAVPVYEGEFFHAFDHRYATWNGTAVVRALDEWKTDPEYRITTRWRYPRERAAKRWSELGVEPGLYVGLRRHARPTDEVTSIAAVLPPSVSEGSVSAFFGPGFSEVGALLLCATLNSYVFNFLLRLRQSGPNPAKSVYEQIPVPSEVARALSTGRADAESGAYQVARWAAELTCTSPEFASIVRAAGLSSLSQRIDPERRRALRLAIDAWMFRAYGVLDFVDVVLASFPLIEKREVRLYSRYRTADDLATLVHDEAPLSEWTRRGTL